MSLVRSALRLALGDYSLYRIYALDARAEAPAAQTGLQFKPVTHAQLAQCGCEALRDLAHYAVAEAHCFGAWSGETLAGACCFWHGRTYAARNFWPLRDGEAKLVQVTVDAQFRGRGVATQLLQYASHEMQEAGFHRLYARIWHSNEPSIRAFVKSGWRYIAFVVELHPFGRKKPLRFERRKKIS